MPASEAMTKVCMFVTNNCKHDFRVLKEARALADAGYDVRIVATLDETTLPYEEQDGVRIIRVALNPLYARVEAGLWRFLACMRRARPRAGVPGTGGSRSDANLNRQQKAEPTGPAPKRRSLLRLPARILFPAVTRRLLKFADYWVRSWRAVRDEPADFYHSNDLSTLPLGCWADYWVRSWRAVRDEPADFYHSNDLSTLPLGCWAKRQTGGRLVYDAHELYSETVVIGRLERRAYRLTERYLIRRADRVITVCQSIARELKDRYNVELPEVVMNCPPKVDVDENRAHRSVRQELGLPDDVPIIVHSGGITVGRGLYNLVRAVRHLREGVLAFVGQPFQGVDKDLSDLVKQENVADRVVFLDPVPPYEHVSYIASASVGVAAFQPICLNYYYVAPNKLFEYLNAGLPVVCSDLPEMKRVVEGYNAGRTFDVEDPADIAAAIEWVLSDKDRYEELRRNARKAAEVYNWENESRKLLAVYKELSGGGPSRD